MKKPETKFRERTYKDLDRLPNTWYESIQQKSIKGTPDLILCINGHFVVIEYKKDLASTPDPIQLHKHKRIEQAKGLVFVASPEIWPAILKKLKLLALAAPPLYS